MLIVNRLGASWDQISRAVDSRWHVQRLLPELRYASFFSCFRHLFQFGFAFVPSHIIHHIPRYPTTAPWDCLMLRYGIKQPSMAIVCGPSLEVSFSFLLSIPRLHHQSTLIIDSGLWWFGGKSWKKIFAPLSSLDHDKCDWVIYGNYEASSSRWINKYCLSLFRHLFEPCFVVRTPPTLPPEFQDNQPWLIDSLIWIERTFIKHFFFLL